MDIPVFINNRNLLTWPKAMADYLSGLPQDKHRLKIFIIDNGSTYEPLLEYYETSPYEIVKLGENVGHRAPWKWEHIDKNIPDKFYIVSDPDMGLDHIPPDVIEHLVEGAERYNTEKCGLGLEIKDLPDTEVACQAEAWERKFWSNPCGNFFRAAIDTTFSLMRICSPMAPNQNTQIRSGYPYVAKHLPWHFEDGIAVPDEYLYYMERCERGISGWGGAVGRSLDKPTFTEVKQQQQWFNEKEQSVIVSTSIDKNVASVTKAFRGYNWKSLSNLKDAINTVLGRIYKKHIVSYVPQDWCVLKTKASLSFNTEVINEEAFMKSSRGKTYVKAMLKGDVFPPIVLVDWRVMQEAGGFHIAEDMAFNLDGMHRIDAALRAGHKEIDVLYVMRRVDIATLLPTDFKKQLREKAKKETWFVKYQQIREVGLMEGRKQGPRFSKIYNLSCVRDSVVADFGGNLGQACIESVFQGANETHCFEYSKHCVDIGSEYSERLGLNLHFHQLDFNEDGWKEQVLSSVEGWDYLIFLAVYRTREIKDIKDVFKFLVSHTRKGIFFEGHAAPEIDTPSFYNGVFRPFKFKSVKFLGHSDARPAYYITI